MDSDCQVVPIESQLEMIYILFWMLTLSQRINDYCQSHCVWFITVVPTVIQLVVVVYASCHGDPRELTLGLDQKRIANDHTTIADRLDCRFSAQFFSNLFFLRVKTKTPVRVLSYLLLEAKQSKA
jgi:hypothetical protein